MPRHAEQFTQFPKSLCPPVPLQRGQVTRRRRTSRIMGVPFVECDVSIMIGTTYKRYRMFGRHAPMERLGYVSFARTGGNSRYNRWKCPAFSVKPTTQGFCWSGLLAVPSPHIRQCGFSEASPGSLSAVRTTSLLS